MSCHQCIIGIVLILAVHSQSYHLGTFTVKVKMKKLFIKPVKNLYSVTRVS